MLRTTVRDCLYLNWALPAEALPPPPEPLRYQRHSWQGRDWVFASALLFHQDSLHLVALPSLRRAWPDRPPFRVVEVDRGPAADQRQGERRVAPLRAG